MVNSIRILIVEDEEIISDGLKKAILATFVETDLQVIIDQALTIKRASSLISKFTYDICSLDVMLPDGNGLDFLKVIRQSKLNSNSKVLMLTTEADANTRIGSFEFGADDYLSKPFLPEEYGLRIKRLLDYKKRMTSKVVKLATNVNLDVMNNSVIISGVKVKLTEQERALLEALCKQYITTKESLVESLGNEFSFESLRMLVSRLRKKLKKQTGYTLIKTEIGVGYSIAEF